MITDVPCANTTVTTLTGAPAMTTSSSISTNSNISSSSSSTPSSSTATLITTTAIGGNSGVLGVGSTGGSGGNSNLSVGGVVSTSGPTIETGTVSTGIAGGGVLNSNQTSNCSPGLVGTATASNLNTQGGNNINTVGGGQQQQQTVQPQQLSPLQQQPLTPQQANSNATPNTCTVSTSASNSTASSSNGNGANVITTSAAVTSCASSISTNTTASSLMQIKEEPNILDTPKEDDSSTGTPPNMSGMNIKKEPMQRLNSNGSANASGIIGSTNTGSLHHGDKSASDPEERKTTSREGTDLDTEFDANFNLGVLTSKDDMLTDHTVGMGTLSSLGNVKKEEPGPDLPSDNFGSIASSLSGGGGNPPSVCMPSSGNSCSAASVVGSRIQTGSSPSEGIQPLTSNILSGSKQGVGGGLDYMQQQNHIFVFSTALANKAAESVLNGQYPTIIAYHCAQPTTKKFLEDFFLKNPLKLSKMNRQNTAQWMNNSISLIGKNNKSSNNSSGNNNNSSNNSNNPNRIVPTTKPPASSNTGFTGDDLPGSDAELLPWEQSGNHMSLDAMANGAGSGANTSATSDPSSLEVDNLVPGSPSMASNRSCSNHMPSSSATSGANVQQSSTTMTTSAMGPTSPSLSGGLQPSLQGVKVPDENLTPQQRQHREEQLAKLKKMNQFLFPEQGGIGPDFVGQGVPSDGDPSAGVPPGTKMMGTGGPPQVSVNMMGGMPGNSQMPMGSGMSGINPSLRGSGMLGMGPRPAGMCRPMGPMGPNTMPDGIMGGVPSNNPAMNDMGNLPCGMMMGNQQGPGGQSMMAGGNGGPSMAGMMPGGGLGQQAMVQGGPMGPGGPMNPCALGSPMGPGMMGQNKHMMGGPGVAQMEWNKLQHQFYEERKGKNMDGIGMGGMCGGNAGGMSGGRQIPPVMRTNSQGGPRSQGPPPPYHQTQRSASVPIATQSPNPGSPNNPTSNLSLPSPRTGSTLNSPAGDHTLNVSGGNQHQQAGSAGNSRRPQSSHQLFYKQDSPGSTGCSSGGNNTGNQGGGSNDGSNGPRAGLSHNSNPSTPISSHMSPNATSLKDLELGNPNSNSGGQGKEPNLMPVPSPQQIQYLNTFEGQELTIQKQPNTTLKDGSIISPPGGNNGPSSGPGGGNDSRISGTSTPLKPATMEPRFPTTPGAGGQVSVGGGGGASAGSTFPIPSSPQTPNTGGAGGQTTGDKNQRLNTSGPSPQGSRTPSMSGDPIQGNPASMNQPSVDSVRFPSTSPVMNFSPVTGANQSSGASSQQVNAMKLGGGFMDVSPNGKCSASGNDNTPTGNFCVRADNLPLNPNSSCPPPAKTSHFDPISSLAQMSQQLTSSVSNSLNGQPGGGGPGPGGGNGGNPGGGMMGSFQNHGGMGMTADMSLGPHHVDGLMSGLDPCMGGVMPNMGQYGMHGSGNAGLPLGMMGGPGPRSLSPKLGSGMVGFPGGPVGMPHRMIGRPPMGGSPYNGANIQVKASTPNTIQYLPARPQVGNTNPRAPPSLEFLQRFANPLSSLDGPPNKVPSGQGMPFYPNCNQIGQPGPGGMGMNAHLDGNSGLGNDGSGMLGMGGMGPSGPMMGQNLMMRGLRPPGQGGIVRMSGPPHMGGGGGGHHHHPFSNGPPNGPNDPSMFPGNQIFPTGSKGNPMNTGGSNGPGNLNHSNQMQGGGPPDASQPLPPTMGGGQAPGGGGFKSSQFVGPSTADPNYAQQYHNFQQQLYATSTRSQMNNQPGGGMTGGPTNPNQSFFVPK